jgi:hypothetical protein
MTECGAVAAVNRSARYWQARGVYSPSMSSTKRLKVRREVLAFRRLSPVRNQRRVTAHWFIAPNGVRPCRKGLMLIARAHLLNIRSAVEVTHDCEKVRGHLASLSSAFGQRHCVDERPTLGRLLTVCYACPTCPPNKKTMSRKLQNDTSLVESFCFRSRAANGPCEVAQDRRYDCAWCASSHVVSEVRALAAV